jgi:multidrug efflux pump subunit AcrB
LKNGSASTLSVVQGAKQAMANVLKTVNSAVRVKEFSDQSVFVRAAISGVVREGVIAGALTALMILLFLGSWREHDRRSDFDSSFGACLARGAKRLRRNN